MRLFSLIIAFRSVEARMPEMVRASTAISAGRVVVVAGAAALVVVLLCAAPAPAAVEAVPAGAEVSEFPGFDGDLPSKHYAGYELNKEYIRSDLLNN
jgi:serine carboxypeptidase-like clade 1